MHSDEIRENLLQRARSYAEAAGTSMSAIGAAAVNDSKWLFRVERGEGFNILTYQRVVDWLAQAELNLSLSAAEDRE